MDGKMKISFGIKASKQSSLPKKAPVKNDVEYISSFDGTCKPISSQETKELVIPFLGNTMKGPLDKLTKVTEELSVGGEEKNAAVAEQGPNPPPSSSLSLEQLAAQELLKDAKGAMLDGKKSVEVVPLPMEQYNDANEATLEDYDSVPVEDFGKAMLRGMGWQPGKGIGKNERVVAPAAPQLRPKGLGLGADRAPSTKGQPAESSQQGAQQAELALTVGCGVQIVAGGHKGLYGKMVSRNEDTGRCIVKLEIGGSCVSVNEHCVNAVSKEEYASSCRVLNAAKYKKYKESSDLKLEKMREKFRDADEAEDRQSSSDGRRRHRSRSPHK
ncbi:G-patch domain and KOW motifs-containing protein [Ischnura elegans]|uniref:G-patch domain and KOW motifs-containing protein n=1 Tax=Ischnura elegans TaxID=197161 RepID=UPI001ED89AE2|nr:G-patch domain and KOW motifs-containing protein [Ischnura elegans]XP_046384537.1 G-patch domain and KOW motifs-containing protein [Ischnura elegans]